MHQAFGRFGVSVFLVFPILIATACGGNPSGPGATGAVAGTAMIDGQTLQFTTARNASGAFRRPTNPAWPRGLLDLRLSACGGDQAIVMSIYDGNPSPGRYEVGSVPFEGVLSASWQHRSGEAWYAGPSFRGSSGSITVSSASSTRVSGSFSFTLIPQVGATTPPPTKLLEGTFDLEINDRVVCPRFEQYRTL